jgi:hypothetical protein
LILLKHPEGGTLLLIGAGGGIVEADEPFIGSKPGREKARVYPSVR